MFEQIKPGLTGVAEVRATEENTAIAYGSGAISVFATPAMIALLEKAALSAVDPLLPEGYTTVGIKVEVEHVAATPLWEELKAQAELTKVQDRRLIFEVKVHDSRRLVGRGIHERFIIQKEDFLLRTASIYR